MPAPHEDEPVEFVNKYDARFVKHIAVEADVWYDTITAEGACVNENAWALFCDSRKAEACITKYCNNCPVRLECISYCLATEQLGCVWGGFDEKQRTAIKLHVSKAIRKKYHLPSQLFPFTQNAFLWEALMKEFTELQNKR